MSRPAAPHRRPALLVLLTLSLALATATRASLASTQAPPPAAAGEAAAQEPPAAPEGAPPAPADVAAQKAEIDELKRRLELLAVEVEALRSGEDQRTPLTADERRVLGLSPSAATVYEQPAGVSFAGYGEMLYENFDATDERGRGPARGSRLDFLRAILYAGYRFNDRFTFNSEVEFEHGGEEVALEFAYLDFRVRDDLTLRGGMILVPLGLVNEFHEPTVFIGARRPETERRIIPSTWHENGVGVLGASGPVSYRAYLVNGFDAGGFTEAGLRSGRQGGAEAKAADWAFAGRLDASPVPGVIAGAGLYWGNSGQDQFEGADVATTIVEVHGQVQARGLTAGGVFARATLDDVAALNAARGLSGTASVGETLQGGYLQVAYDLLSQRASRVSLAPYYRFEEVDTQREVPAGFRRNPANDVRFHTLGVELKPVGGVVVKTDYQWVSNRAGSGRNQLNVLLGYAF